MFAIEQSSQYDPSRPSILDGRPHSMQFTRHQSPIRGSEVTRKENVAPSYTSPVQPQAKNSLEEQDHATNLITPLSPSRLNSPPTKSSLSKKTGAAFRRSGFDPETGIWEDDDDIQSRQLPAGRGLHRHQKSVTFDQKPPQVNEYEMATPAPSSCASGSREGSYQSNEDYEDEDASFERGSSMDQDDSFDASLEDTDKTPVVLPEDWRFMSPNTANKDLSRGEEDVFDDDCGSPAPTAQPGTLASRPHQTSASSLDSNGQSRPLPPLPPGGGRQSKNEKLSGTLERLSISGRSLPTPPMSAGISKADIQKMGVSSSLTGDDRLRLMALQEQERERRMRRMGSKETSPVRDASLEKFHMPRVADSEMSESRDSTPQLSRAAVLQALRSDPGQDSRESSEGLDVETQGRDVSYDPDVPIPSLEDPTQPKIKQEEQEEEDLYSITDFYSRRVSDSETSATQDDDLTSQYSQASQAPVAHPIIPDTEEGQDTPKARSPTRELISQAENRMSLPEFTDFGNASGFDVGFGSYLANNDEKAKPNHGATQSTDLPDLAALRQSIQRSYTPEIQHRQYQAPLSAAVEEAVPGSPGSVVRHSNRHSNVPLNDGSDMSDTKSAAHDDSDRSVSPSESGSVVVHDKEPSPVSPISAEFEDKPDSLSADPVNSTRMEEQQTQTSHKILESNRVSSLVQLDIPHDSLDEGLGLGLEKEFDRVVEAQKVEFELSLQRLYYPFNGRFPSVEFPCPRDPRIENPMDNIPALPRPREARTPIGRAISPSHSVSEDSFANRAGRQQRGYLMRQNTKIVYASEHISQDESRSPELPGVQGDSFGSRVPDANLVQTSPRKSSQPTWTAEPWNGKMRRKSIRVGGEKAMSKRKQMEGPVPPLPGQMSNAQETLDVVAEDEIAEDEEWEDGAERGRLFVKVVGVKDLQMPFPQRKYCRIATISAN